MRTRIFTTLVLLLSLSFFSGKVQAQYYLTGQDPASVKWEQIKTKEFQLVFPNNYDSIAQYYANLLKLSARYIRQPYLKKVKPITIILHNESTESNAMVSPAPFHADFFEMPSQETYPQIWQKQLVLHEYRHVVQMSKLRQGFGNFLYILLGEQGTALLMAGLPQWFIEGDAVFSETIHSKSGRGRVPEFIYPLEAQVLNKKIYPYDKAQFGSYKDFVPDYYTLGYQLVLKGVEQYGTRLWNDALNRVARKPFTLFPFSINLHKITGTGKVKFYHKTLSGLRKKWQSENQQYKKGNFKTIATQNRFYTNYLFPNILSNGNLIFEKSGLDDINRFVMLTPTGKETRLFTPGFDFNESLSANDSLICWNEVSFDKRWGNRNYSNIIIYNFHTKKITRLTRKGRYFAPALSPDSKNIVAVRVDEQLHYFLDFIDVNSHKIYKTFKTPNNLFFMTPHWSPDSKYIVTCVLGNKGKSILLLNTHTMKYRYLLPFSFTEIKWPVIHGNWVVYTAAYEGKDDLYAVNIKTGNIFRLLGARFGANGARFSQNGKKIFFSNYTANGFKPSVMTFDSTKLLAFNPKQTPFRYPIDKLVNKTTFILDDSVVPQKIYPIKKYSRLGHLFNIYGWGPFSLNLNNFAIGPGVSILSQNDLSTAVSTLNYSYDMNQQTGKLGFSFNYYGWYPEIGFNVTRANRRNYLIDKNHTQKEIRWSETNVSLNVKLPLNLSRGKVIAGVQPYVSYKVRFLAMAPGSQYHFTKPQINTLSFQLYGYRYFKSSPKDLYPKWGQTILLTYQNTPFTSQKSSQFTVQTRFYFPGIINHQGLSLYFGFENQGNGNYPFSNLVSVPRGYSGLFFNKYVSLKADYAFPIAYPDWDLQGAFYLKRIYSHAFYDYLKNLNTNASFSSLGLELYTEWNFVSLFPAVTLGLRWNYLKTKNSSTFDFLFGINF